MVDELCERCDEVTKTEVISRGRLWYRRCNSCGKPRSYQPYPDTPEKMKAYENWIISKGRE